MFLTRICLAGITPPLLQSKCILQTTLIILNGMGWLSGLLLLDEWDKRELTQTISHPCTSHCIMFWPSWILASVMVTLQIQVFRLSMWTFLIWLSCVHILVAAFLGGGGWEAAGAARGAGLGVIVGCAAAGDVTGGDCGFAVTKGNSWIMETKRRTQTYYLSQEHLAHHPAHHPLPAHPPTQTCSVCSW